MTHFDEPFWNLAQAAAWVVYREKKLVDNLADPKAGSFAAIGMYPSLWPDHRKQHGELSALHNALSDGRLKAKGCHEDEPDTLAESLLKRGPTLTSTLQARLTKDTPEKCTNRGQQFE